MKTTAGKVCMLLRKETISPAVIVDPCENVLLLSYAGQRNFLVLQQEQVLRFVRGVDVNIRRVDTTSHTIDIVSYL